MKIINRYIRSVILKTIFTVLLAVAGIEIFIMLVGELGDIGRAQYSLFNALIYILLNLPDQLYQFFPMIGLLGMLMGLGLLANHSELIILQSSGLSQARIALISLKSILLLLLCMSLVGEVIAPRLNQYAMNYKEKKTNDHFVQHLLASHVWVHIGNNFLYVQAIDEKKILHDIHLFEFDTNNKLLSILTANNASYARGLWEATNIKEEKFLDNHIDTQYYSHVNLPLVLNPNLLINSTQNPTGLSLPALQQTLKFNKANHSDDAFASLMFWRRILQPLAALVMMLLALPFVFGSLRQSTHSLRLVIGIVLGFLFYYLNAFFGPIILLFHWSPLLGALFPTLIFSLAGILLLIRKQS